MAAPWATAVVIEWLVLSRAFALPGEAGAGGLPPRPAPETQRRSLPRAPLVILAATLLGFILAGPLGTTPLAVGASGALVMTLAVRPPGAELLRAAQPRFLVAVLALAIVVHLLSIHGLARVVDGLLPTGRSLADLLATALLAAVLANVVNNLPATLILLPRRPLPARRPSSRR